MIYFLRAGDTEFVKIGYADNVAKRIAELQTGCPHELVLIRSLAGSQRDEGFFHSRYHERRIRGEWFLFCEDMLTAEAPPRSLDCHAAIIDLWPTAEDLARDIGADGGLVRAWRWRNSIPGRYILAVAEAAEKRGFVEATLDKIVRLTRPRARAAA